MLVVLNCALQSGCLPLQRRLGFYDPYFSNLQHQRRIELRTEPFLCLILLSFSSSLAFAILSFPVSCDLSYSESTKSTFKEIVVVRLAIMQLRSGRAYLVMLLCLTSCHSPERHDDLPPHYKKMGDLSPHLLAQIVGILAGGNPFLLLLLPTFFLFLAFGLTLTPLTPNITSIQN